MKIHFEVCVWYSKTTQRILEAQSFFVRFCLIECTVNATGNSSNMLIT